MRILVADDNDIIRRGVLRILEARPGLLCAEVANGKEAVEKAIAWTPDLILLDLSMPMLDGFEAAKEIKQRLPKVRILFFSIYDTKEVIQKAKSMGDGLVLKDRAGTMLLDAVDTLLQNKPFFPS